jgi:ribosomal protein S14
MASPVRVIKKCRALTRAPERPRPSRTKASACDFQGYPGAIYHVMSRGDRREDIFLDDVDRQDFLKTLAEACHKTTWEVHAYSTLPPAQALRAKMNCQLIGLTPATRYAFRLSRYAFRLSRYATC